jgi:hypothetical protein
MTPHAHDADLDARLLAYWLDEMGGEESARIEEQLFACEHCAARLRELLELRAAVGRALSDSRFATAVTPQFVERLRNLGLHLREYFVEPGASTYCTMSPQDDFVISRLRAPLEGVGQVDLVVDDGERQLRAARIPYSAAANEVTVIPPVAVLRNLKFATQRMRLYAVAPSSERLLGEYTFNHEPWGTRQDGR